jgi:DNA-binding transcriptional MocR family regulator
MTRTAVPEVLLTPVERPVSIDEAVLQRVRQIVRECPHGTRLPSERDLADQLGVARTTLRRSLAAIAADGWLTVRRGRGINGGTHVHHPPLLPVKNLDLDVTGTRPGQPCCGCSARVDGQNAHLWTCYATTNGPFVRASTVPRTLGDFEALRYQ